MYPSRSVVGALGMARFASFLRNFELSHNTSVITSHVGCVVCLCVFAPGVMSCLSQSSWWSSCIVYLDLMVRIATVRHCTYSSRRSVACWLRSTSQPHVRMRIVPSWSDFSNFCIATPCLLANFPDSNIMRPCCVSHISLPWLQVSEINITSRLLVDFVEQFFWSLSLEFINLVFFLQDNERCLFGHLFLLESEANSCCCCFFLWLSSMSTPSSCTDSASSLSWFFLFLPRAAALWMPLFVVSSLIPVKKTFLLSLLLKKIWIMSVSCFFCVFLRDYS